MDFERLNRRGFLQRLLAVAGASLVWTKGWADLPTAARPLQSGKNRVLRTANEELTRMLAGRNAPRGIVADVWSDHPSAHALAKAGLLSIQKTPAAKDAYEVLVREDVLYVLGTTPRGLLHAVFALEEALVGGESLVQGFHRFGEFQFSERIFHARFDVWPGTRPDVRFLAHLGATHCLVSHDWQGNHRSLQGYVTSPIFPEAIPPAEVAENRAGLRRLLDACSDYGLGAMLWLTELPCQGGPWLTDAVRKDFLRRYPAEVLSESGTNEGKVLCFGHARVHAFYRDLLERFFAEFPEIETIFLFGLDSGGEFCDPQSCPRCRGMSRIAQRDRLVCFMVDEGRKVRPGLRVLTTGWKWDREPQEFLRHQAALPAGSGVYLAAQKDGWQCERQSHDFLREVRRVCRERGQTFIGYDNFHWGDDSVHKLGDIQDFPLGIAAKLRRWHALRVEGVFDHWGNSPEDIWSNSIACREFFLNPEADASVLCRRIADRQFGRAAGALVFAAWEALEQAHARLSVACLWSPEQWPMWYAGRKKLPLPGPDGFGPKNLAQSRQPPRRAGVEIYNPADFTDALQVVADAWSAAFPFFEMAAAQLKKAEEVAGDERVFYHFWWNGVQPTPTRREHIRRQRRYVESTGIAGREIGLHFGLHALWEKAGHEPAAYRLAAAQVLRDDASACRAAAIYFDGLGKPKDWGALYAAKASAIDAFLSK